MDRGGGLSSKERAQLEKAGSATPLNGVWIGLLASKCQSGGFQATIAQVDNVGGLWSSILLHEYV